MPLQAPKPPFGSAPKHETPQERLKRIMQAQLSKQAGKDMTASHVKQAQVGDTLPGVWMNLSR